MSSEALDALKTIMEGFDKGVFVRSVERDDEAGWAMRLLPYLNALRKAQECLAKAEGEK